MDRAAKIARFINKPKYASTWSDFADQIKEDIMKHGWNEEEKSFTMYYGGNALDASNLLMLHYGFLSNHNQKMVSTVKQAYKKLVKNDLTFRYIEEDEFGVPQNAFIVCTFWMINALYLIGEEEKAYRMFENILTSSNHLGLFSEDIDPQSKQLTGNFPQGYSHLAFIQTVLLLETKYNWSDAFGVKSTPL